MTSFCMVCDISRERDFNHWFNLVSQKNRNGLAQVTIKPWNEYDAREAEKQTRDQDAEQTVASACGQSHALTLVERFLSTGGFSRAV